MKSTMSFQWVMAATMIMSVGGVRDAVAQTKKVPEKGEPRDVTPATQAAEREKPTVAVIRLKHTQPHDIGPLITRALARYGISVAVDDRSNALVVTAPPDVVRDIEALVQQLDTPGEAPLKTSAQYFDLPFQVGPDFVNAARMVLSDQARVSATDNLLVVVGTPQEHEAVSELVRRMEQQHGRPGKAARGLQVSFFFLRAAVGGGKTARESRAGSSPTPLPEGLKAVSAALAESGFQRAELLAPLTVQTGATGQPFELRGSASDIEQIQIKGSAGPLPGSDAVELRIDSDLLARVIVNEVTDAGGNKHAQYSNKQIFSLQTTIQARLGDYLVLAASPSQPGEDAIALVVRVTAVP